MHNKRIKSFAITHWDRQKTAALYAIRFQNFNMDCKEYREFYSEYTKYPVPKEIWVTAHYETWQDHIHKCEKYSDWTLEQQVIQRGGKISEWPCLHMAYHATFVCDEHTELYSCSKAIILYNEKFDEYSIGPRGGCGDEYQNLTSN